MNDEQRLRVSCLIPHVHAILTVLEDVRCQLDAAYKVLYSTCTEETALRRESELGELIGMFEEAIDGLQETDEQLCHIIGPVENQEQGE